MHPQDTARDEDFEALSSIPRRVSWRIRIVLVAVLVLIAGIITVRQLTGADPTEQITIYGLPVADPGGVLDTAQQQVEQYTAEQRGALADDAKCWFQRPPGSSDVGSTLLCGPVQFYDDDPSTPYLPVKLTAHGSNPVRLDVAGPPPTPALVAAADDTTLVRPDGTADPLTTTTVVAPNPPPADPDTLTMTDRVNPSELGHAPDTAVIGSDTITVQLLAGNSILGFGTGAAARSAPNGMELFAFRLAFRGGENGYARLSKLDLRVAIGGAAPRPLDVPDTGVGPSGLLFVVATEPNAPLELQLTQRGVTQGLSLRDGTPDPGNIAFLRTAQQLDVRPVQRSAPATLIRNGKHIATRIYAGLISGTRQFFLPGSGAHPADTDHVFLLLNLGYWVGSIRGLHQLDASVLTVTPRGGSPIRAQRYGLYGGPVFDVPADMTEATLTVQGTQRGAHYSVAVHDPMTLPLRLISPTS